MRHLQLKKLNVSHILSHANILQSYILYGALFKRATFNES